MGSNLQIWASPDCPEAVQEAKDYIVNEGYTKDEVKLVRSGDMILVVKR